MNRFPGGSGSRGIRRDLLPYLIERLVEMPYLWWIWVIVLLTCLLFTMLDNKKVVGIQQAIYGISLLVMLMLRGAEMHSFGYYTIWALGVIGLLTYLVIKYSSSVMIMR